ncbi:WASH complex subunit FAM21C [Pelomyxa schiedti]|nr:WASH complex subunit FAM21C [Pelomyxa schiedti]
MATTGVPTRTGSTPALLGPPPATPPPIPPSSPSPSISAAAVPVGTTAASPSSPTSSLALSSSPIVTDAAATTATTSTAAANPSPTAVVGPLAPVDAAPVVKQKKPWNRQWTLAELRTESKDWSLGSDYGLMSYLKTFSAQLMARTQALQGEVNGLVHQSRVADVNLHNTFNNFLMLSNTQYIENRVDEDDPAELTANADKRAQAEPKDETPTQQQIMEKNASALAYGIQEMIKFYGPVSVPQTPAAPETPAQVAPTPDSASTAAAPAPPKTQGRDVWSNLPLPCVYGTDDYIKDDHCGLLAEDDDEDEEEMETEIEEPPKEEESILPEVDETKDKKGDESDFSSEDEKPTASTTISPTDAATTAPTTSEPILGSEGTLVGIDNGLPEIAFGENGKEDFFDGSPGVENNSNATKSAFGEITADGGGMFEDDGIFSRENKVVDEDESLFKEPEAGGKTLDDDWLGGGSGGGSSSIFDDLDKPMDAGNTNTNSLSAGILGDDLEDEVFLDSPKPVQPKTSAPTTTTTTSSSTKTTAIEPVIAPPLGFEEEDSILPTPKEDPVASAAPSSLWEEEDDIWGPIEPKKTATPKTVQSAPVKQTSAPVKQAAPQPKTPSSSLSFLGEDFAEDDLGIEEPAPKQSAPVKTAKAPAVTEPKSVAKVQPPPKKESTFDFLGGEDDGDDDVIIGVAPKKESTAIKAPTESDSQTTIPKPDAISDDDDDVESPAPKQTVTSTVTDNSKFSSSSLSFEGDTEDIIGDLLSVDEVKTTPIIEPKKQSTDVGTTKKSTTTKKATTDVTKKSTTDSPKKATTDATKKATTDTTKKPAAKKATVPKKTGATTTTKKAAATKKAPTTAKKAAPSVKASTPLDTEPPPTDISEPIAPIPEVVPDEKDILPPFSEEPEDTPKKEAEDTSKTAKAARPKKKTGSKVGNLQATLHLDPTLMLSGRRPTHKKEPVPEEEGETPPSTSLDGPPGEGPRLVGVTKTRAKPARGRHPPTLRKAKVQKAEGMDDDDDSDLGDEDTFAKPADPSPPKPKPTTPAQPSVDSLLFDEKPSSSASHTSLPDDLFDSPLDLPTATKKAPAKQTATKTKATVEKAVSEKKETTTTSAATVTADKKEEPTKKAEAPTPVAAKKAPPPKAVTTDLGDLEDDPMFSATKKEAKSENFGLFD